MEDDQVYERLRGLSTDQLADALIALANDNAAAQDTVQRLIAKKSESITRYKAKLLKLATADRFITWRETHAFSRELEQMLLDLQAGVEDADTGFDLITAFFEADTVIFEQCDDSSGAVGDVFSCTAADLLARYGAGCADQTRVINRLVALYGEDDYGIREVVIDAAHRFLPPASLRALAEQLRERGRHAVPDSFAARHWFLGIASVARQLRDAPLFEQAQRAIHAELPAAVHIDIAAAYFEAGDAATARIWLERQPDNPYHAVSRDALLLKVAKQLGDTDTAKEVAWRMFDAHHNEDSLQNLLAVIGEEQRDHVVTQTTETILHDEQFSASDADFLTRTGRMADAETYILAHAEQLNGEYYSSLLPLAECMEREECWLAATVIYRALTESILQRAVTKYYHHGVRYLRKLDAIAVKIAEWHDFADQTGYLDFMRHNHGRKSSFWSQYSG